MDEVRSSGRWFQGVTQRAMYHPAKAACGSIILFCNKMKYPDGTKVCLGDHIWWNEGSCIGYISAIVESKIDQQTWGFEEPHIIISCDHPHNPEETGGVAYGVGDFEDEGIGRLSPAEEENLAKSIEAISISSSFKLPFRVGCDIQILPKGQWVFGVIDSDGYREIGRVANKSQAEQAAT